MQHDPDVLESVVENLWVKMMSHSHLNMMSSLIFIIECPHAIREEEIHYWNDQITVYLSRFSELSYSLKSKNQV